MPYVSLGQAQKLERQRIKEFEKMIRRCQFEQEISQEKAAKLMEMSVPTWRSRRANPMTMTLAEVKKLARVFDVPLDEIRELVF